MCRPRGSLTITLRRIVWPFMPACFVLLKKAASRTIQESPRVISYGSKQAGSSSHELSPLSPHPVPHSALRFEPVLDKSERKEVVGANSNLRLLVQLTQQIPDSFSRHCLSQGTNETVVA